MISGGIDLGELRDFGALNGLGGDALEKFVQKGSELTNAKTEIICTDWFTAPTSEKDNFEYAKDDPAKLEGCKHLLNSSIWKMRDLKKYQTENYKYTDAEGMTQEVDLKDLVGAIKTGSLNDESNVIFFSNPDEEVEEDGDGRSFYAYLVLLAADIKFRTLRTPASGEPPPPPPAADEVSPAEPEAAPEEAPEDDESTGFWESILKFLSGD